MKKLLLLCLIVMSIGATAQIVNPGFETPDNQNTGPDRWSNFGMFILPIDSNCVWSHFDSMELWTNEAHTGNKAFQLGVATFCTYTFGGTLKINMYKNIDTFADQRQPFTDMPDAFTFYYKFEQILDDKVIAEASLELSDGTQIATGELIIQQAAPGWVMATMPLFYNDTTHPEYVMMRFRLANDTAVHYGSRFIVDDINTIFPASVDLAKKNDRLLQCYPVPAKDVLNITIPKPTVQSCVLIVVDALGRTVMEQSIPANKNNYPISIANLPQGFYSLKLSNATDIFTGRFVK